MTEEAIFCIVERGKANEIVKAAIAAGAKGATIFYGRGAGEATFSLFRSLGVDAAKEIIFIAVAADIRPAVFEAVCTAGKLREPGRGMAFVMPLLASSL